MSWYFFKWKSILWRWSRLEDRFKNYWTWTCRVWLWRKREKPVFHLFNRAISTFSDKRHYCTWIVSRSSPHLIVSTSYSYSSTSTPVCKLDISAKGSHWHTLYSYLYSQQGRSSNGYTSVNCPSETAKLHLLLLWIFESCMQFSPKKTLLVPHLWVCLMFSEGKFCVPHCWLWRRKSREMCMH